MAEFLSPPDLSKTLLGVGEKKAALPVPKMFILGILAGVYIGFAAHLATTISTGPFEWFGVQKFLTGAVFACGLMLVIIPGSELWTGNNLMTVALCQKRITFGAMLRNWVFVYAGNLVGSVFLAVIIAKFSGLLSGPVGGTAIKIASAKTASANIGDLSHNFAFFFRGIGCNWLVCLAVMMAVSAQDIAGKVWGIFFPIMAFVASGFEHCIANMYFIPAGIFAKDFTAAVEASKLDPSALDAINWGTMWSYNLISVTLGNLVGGAIFTGMVYWWIFVRGTKEA
ncbi:MAG TPA: formate/nitrite transporter family protein [Candidatus Brocadiia bacterium]|nr:formate/nitrite transporter family protein [Candidatus Brocadiia bacterium]